MPFWSGAVQARHDDDAWSVAVSKTTVELRLYHALRHAARRLGAAGRHRRGDREGQVRLARHPAQGRWASRALHRDRARWRPPAGVPPARGGERLCGDRRADRRRPHHWHPAAVSSSAPASWDFRGEFHLGDLPQTAQPGRDTFKGTISITNGLGEQRGANGAGRALGPGDHRRSRSCPCGSRRAARSTRSHCRSPARRLERELTARLQVLDSGRQADRRAVRRRCGASAAAGGPARAASPAGPPAGLAVALLAGAIRTRAGAVGAGEGDVWRPPPTSSTSTGSSSLKAIDGRWSSPCATRRTGRALARDPALRLRRRDVDRALRGEAASSSTGSLPPTPGAVRHAAAGRRRHGDHRRGRTPHGDRPPRRRHARSWNKRRPQPAVRDDLRSKG